MKREQLVASPSHIIQRQIFELSVDNQASARALQDQASQLCRKILPELERHLTHLAIAQGVIRIDRLEIDLGDISQRDFNQQCLNTLKEKLPKVLSDNIHSMTKQKTLEKDDSAQTKASTSQSKDYTKASTTQRAIALLNFVFDNGILPWWADHKDREAVVKAIEHLLSEPKVLLEGLKLWRQQPHMLTRFIHSISDQQSITLLTTTTSPFTSAQHTMLVQLSEQLSIVDQECRHVLWSEIWQYVFDGKKQGRSKKDFFEVVVRQLLEHPSAKEGNVRSILAGFNELSNILTDLALDQHSVVTEQKPIDLHRFTIMLQQLKSGDITLSGLDALYQQLNSQVFSVPQIKEIQQALARLNNNTVQGDELHTYIVELQQRLQHELNSKPRDHIVNGKTSRPNGQDKKSEQAQEHDLDAIYIDNAGLVLFWPFLPQFFANNNLLENRQFKGQQQQHRSAALLAYLASNETTFFEHQLTLNKILCGIDLEDVWQPQTPLTTEEIQTGDELINAVMEHVPVLKSTSVEGLRTSFLQREGVIKTRDGNWLLQVEQQNHDVLLSHVPWEFDTIKLPWMPNPLRVEWQ